MVQNPLNQSDRKILKLSISLEQTGRKPDFLHIDTDSWKLKVD